MEPKTVKEAQRVIKEYPDKDDFICRHVQFYMFGGDHYDNSIELAGYWKKCKQTVDNSINQ